MRKVILSVLVAAGLAIAGPALAGDVAIFGDTPFGANRAGLLALYDSHPDHTGVNIATIDAASLAGIELLWLLQPGSPYSAGQLATLDAFLGGGGRIAFLGEHGAIAPGQNANITAAIAALGGHIAIDAATPGDCGTACFDPGFRTANLTGAGSGGTILDHPLTEGVDEYRYAAFAPLLMGPGSETLMLGDNGVQVMMGFENVGPGSYFLITDQNPLDAGVITSFDNTRMFLNLLEASVVEPPVPEPATLTLVGVGLVGLGVMRYRRRK